MAGILCAVGHEKPQGVKLLHETWLGQTQCLPSLAKAETALEKQAYDQAKD